MKKFPALILVVVVAAAAASAAPGTAARSLPGRTWTSVDLTLKQARPRFPGLEKTPTLLNQRQAVVTCDDSTTSSAALTKATTDAGYPPKQVS